jgi:hypothetical protein
MKRELSDLIRLERCCPGHDIYPNETYANNRSKRARSRDKKIEHRYVRRVKEYRLRQELVKGAHEAI